MSEQRTLFGRLALAMLGPRPALGRLATLAQSHPSAAVPIEVSKRKLRLWLALYLLCVLPMILLAGFLWMAGAFPVALLFFLLIFLSCFFTGLQLVHVARSRQPPLVLEKEGLRVGFTGDLIRYDQIKDVSYSRYGAAMLLKVAPGTKLESGRMRYGLAFLGAPLAICSAYKDPIMELGEEIKRRMKIAAPRVETPGLDPMSPRTRTKGFTICALAGLGCLFAFAFLSWHGQAPSRDAVQMRGMLVVAGVSLWIFGAMIFLFPRQQ